jgi:hypothetical protein
LERGSDAQTLGHRFQRLRTRRQRSPQGNPSSPLRAIRSAASRSWARNAAQRRRISERAVETVEDLEEALSTASVHALGNRVSSRRIRRRARAQA